MKKELIDLLTSYLYGWKTLYDCAEWLASINWDNLKLDSDALELVGSVELIASEVIEGLRPQSEFWNIANEIVSCETNTYIIRKTTSNRAMVNSTSDVVVTMPQDLVVGV